MKGLLIKDLLVLRTNARNTLLFLLIYCIVFGVISQDASMVSGIAIIMLTTLSISTFTYDNLARWESYALCLPVTRKQMVQAKYLLSLLFAAAGAVLSLFLGLGISAFGDQGPQPIDEILSLHIGMLAASLICISFLLPLIYKFGIEKSKIIFIAIVGVPTLLGYLLSRLEVQLPPIENPQRLLWLLPVIILGLLIGSYCVSCRIFSKKEF